MINCAFLRYSSLDICIGFYCALPNSETKTELKSSNNTFNVYQIFSKLLQSIQHLISINIHNVIQNHTFLSKPFHLILFHDLSARRSPRSPLIEVITHDCPKKGTRPLIVYTSIADPRTRCDVTPSWLRKIESYYNTYIISIARSRRCEQRQKWRRAIYTRQWSWAFRKKVLRSPSTRTH